MSLEHQREKRKITVNDIMDVVRGLPQAWHEARMLFSKNSRVGVSVDHTEERTPLRTFDGSQPGAHANYRRLMEVKSRRKGRPPVTPSEEPSRTSQVLHDLRKALFEQHERPEAPDLQATRVRRQIEKTINESRTREETADSLHYLAFIGRAFDGVADDSPLRQRDEGGTSGSSSGDTGDVTFS